MPADSPQNPAVVQVAVPRPVRRVFDYLAAGDADLLPGMRVRVPFAGTQVVGIVAGVGSASSFELKAIEEVLDERPILSSDLIDLATWMASYYHHPIGDVYARHAAGQSPTRRGGSSRRRDDLAGE